MLPRLEPSGPRAWLVRFADQPDEAALSLRLALEERLRADPPAGLAEVVPGFTSLLLDFHPGHRPDPAALAPWLRAPGAPPARPARVVEIAVVYDGPDLARVAAHHGMGVEEVVRLHAGARYRVHLLGFMPGFAYLAGLPERLRTPRLPSPRPRVGAGSVGIGGGQTAVYPLASPGGWNLIGRARRPLFLPNAGDDRAFVLRPGDEVRFVPAGGG